MNSGGLYGTPILGRLTRGALAAICRLSNSWEFGSEPQFTDGQSSRPRARAGSSWVTGAF